jgi:preprotein translocase subunit SecE
MMGFLKDVKLELGRVHWPTRQETIKYTGIVVVFSVVMSLFLGGVDAIFTIVLNRFILN